MIVNRLMLRVLLYILRNMPGMPKDPALEAEVERTLRGHD